MSTPLHSTPRVKSATITKLLQSQGFGTRRDCEILIAQGAVEWNGEAIEYIDDAFPALEGTPYRVNNEPHEYRHRAYIVLNKPEGYECSQKPKQHQSVYNLLPTYLRQRGDSGARNGVQCVGRLDQDTTGLLLLSDDGQFIHQYTSPKKHVNKVYAVTTKHAITGAMMQALSDGVVLNDAMGDTPEPVKALDTSIKNDRLLHLTITEGRYHQVKRMIAAAGNRCEALHRLSVGDYSLPDDLMPGQWRFVSAL
jgi:16S rRNA pseudouridine516 synthase